MAPIRFEISVADASGMVANFHRADAEVQRELKRVVHVAGELTKELTQLFCPVDTGFMQAHVRTDYSPSGLKFETGWKAGDFFGAGLIFYPWFVVYGTRHMPPRDPLTPAYAEVRPQLQADISAAVQASMARLAAKANASAARRRGARRLG